MGRNRRTQPLPAFFFCLAAGLLSLALGQLLHLRWVGSYLDWIPWPLTIAEAVLATGFAIAIFRTAVVMEPGSAQSESGSVPPQPAVQTAAEVRNPEEDPSDPEPRFEPDQDDVADDADTEAVMRELEDLANEIG